MRVGAVKCLTQCGPSPAEAYNELGRYILTVTRFTPVKKIYLSWISARL